MAEELKKQHYNEDDIAILHGLEGVQKRPAMYIGSTGQSGLHHLVWEIVDNAVDEALNGFGTTIEVTIHKDGSVSVQDDGRGIPTGIHKEAKIPAVELIFTTLHSGGKFSNKAYTTSAGMHGVGASVTNALSDFVDVTIWREGKIHHIRFEDGGKVKVPLEIIGNTNKHGTLVTFKPSASIFTSVDFKWQTIFDHLQESAYLLKKIKFVLKDERTNISQTFYYENGIQQFVEDLNENKNTLDKPLYMQDEIDQIKVEIAMQYCYNDYNETIYSYVNNIRTVDGGTHETGFRTGLTRAVNDFAEANNLIRGKNKLEGSDIREGLTAIISLRIPENMTEFEGQTKGKLGTPQVLNVVSNFIYNKFTYYLAENKEFSINLIKKCQDAQNARVAARKAKEEARASKSKKAEVIITDKLTPAQSKDYAKNELFIVEGESAGGTARNGRDRIHQAVLPLRGKPLNTDSTTIAKMLENKEFATIINAIGAGYGQAFDISEAKYGKVIIMTDADTDGAHIQTLLLTFFYNFMRSLITSGHVYVAVPPLYRVSKEVSKTKEVYEYAWNDKDLAEAKKKIGPGYKISRFKGLGEMNAQQLKETTMDPNKRQLIQINIDNPFLAEKRISTLMGKDTALRRKWVEENVDFSTEDNFLKEQIHGEKKE